MRRELDRLQAITYSGSAGTFRQTTEPTKPQIDFYPQLDLPLPRKTIEITQQPPDQAPSHTRRTSAITRLRRSAP